MLISIHQCWISAPKFKSWQWVAKSSGQHVMYIFLLKNSRFVTNTVFVFTAWAALVSTHLVMETVTRNDMFLNEGKRCKPNLLSKPLGWKTQQKQISATKFARRRRQEFWPVPHHDAGKIYQNQIRGRAHRKCHILDFVGYHNHNNEKLLPQTKSRGVGTWKTLNQSSLPQAPNFLGLNTLDASFKNSTD